jgi:hypothetical protein
MSVEESIARRIEELLQRSVESASAAGLGELQMAAISICVSIYGANSPQLRSIETTRKELWGSKYAEGFKQKLLAEHLHGLLRSVASDIQGGRIRDLQLQARGEVFGDFINAARSALSDGFKDVAAVLACAALEDALKRFAVANGLAVYDKDMAEVVNALKGAGLLKGPQGALLQGFVKVRNKAFHAQWDSIESPDVQGVIAFTQEFLLSRFPSA